MNASGLVGFSSIFVKNIVRLQILTLILSASSIKSITITTVDVPLCWLISCQKRKKKKNQVQLLLSNLIPQKNIKLNLFTRQRMYLQ